MDNVSVNQGMLNIMGFAEFALLELNQILTEIGVFVHLSTKYLLQVLQHVKIADQTHLQMQMVKNVIVMLGSMMLMETVSKNLYARPIQFGMMQPLLVNAQSMAKI